MRNIKKILVLYKKSVMHRPDVLIISLAYSLLSFIIINYYGWSSMFME